MDIHLQICLSSQHVAEFDRVLLSDLRRVDWQGSRMHNLQTASKNGASIFEHLSTKVHEVLKHNAVQHLRFLVTFFIMFYYKDTRD